MVKSRKDGGGNEVNSDDEEGNGKDPVFMNPTDFLERFTEQMINRECQTLQRRIQYRYVP